MSSEWPNHPFWESESREFALVCSRDGTVHRLDTRARARLGLQPGESFLELTAPGTRERAAELLARARREDRERLARQSEVILSKESLSRELAINRIRDALSKAGVGGSVANLGA